MLKNDAIVKGQIILMVLQKLILKQQGRNKPKSQKIEDALIC